MYRNRFNTAQASAKVRSTVTPEFVNIFHSSMLHMSRGCRTLIWQPVRDCRLLRKFAAISYSFSKFSPKYGVSDKKSIRFEAPSQLSRRTSPYGVRLAHQSCMDTFETSAVVCSECQCIQRKPPVVNTLVISWGCQPCQACDERHCTCHRISRHHIKKITLINTSLHEMCQPEISGVETLSIMNVATGGSRRQKVIVYACL